jgi:carbonic anhydrase
MPAVEKLIAGFRAFRAKYFEQRPELFGGLASVGQKPEVLVIACSDSRVDPAILLNAEPGELFVVRNVAALVPPYEPDENHHGTSAALEFAVRDLGVGHVVVLGHSQCGGVDALRHSLAGDPLPPREFIGPWMSLAAEDVRTCVHEQAGAVTSRALEEAAIRTSITNLRTFPWIAAAEAEGRLKLHGWRFDFDGGALFALDQNGGFTPIVAGEILAG